MECQAVWLGINFVCAAAQLAMKTSNQSGAVLPPCNDTLVITSWLLSLYVVITLWLLSLYISRSLVRDQITYIRI